MFFPVPFYQKLLDSVAFRLAGKLLRCAIGTEQTKFRFEQKQEAQTALSVILCDVSCTQLN